MIRDSTKSASEEIVCFGRYRNYMYKEVPEGYLRWATQEVEANANASMDLRKLANYGREKLNPQDLEDPEKNATVKYIPSVGDSRTDGYSSQWTTVSEPAGSQAPFPPKTKASASKKTHARSDDHEARPMNQDVPPEVLEELKNLSTQMALIKSKYGLHDL